MPNAVRTINLSMATVFGMMLTALLRIPMVSASAANKDIFHLKVDACIMILIALSTISTLSHAKLLFQPSDWEVSA